MRYMLLIHHDEAAMAAAPQKELWADYAAFNDALAKAGLSGGERLEPPAKAKVVRTGNGRAGIVDGPYAETKEQFAGYFFVDVPTIDDAIAWAERCPSSRYGSIEVRPVHVPQPGAWK